MVMTPATAAAAAPAASGGAQQQRQHHPTFLPLMTGASRQRRGGSRGQIQWAPLTVRSIATGPPKSAGALPVANLSYCRAFSSFSFEMFKRLVVNLKKAGFYGSILVGFGGWIARNGVFANDTMYCGHHGVLALVGNPHH